MFAKQVFLFRNKANAAWYKAKPMLKRWFPRMAFAILVWLLLQKQHFSFQITIGTPPLASVAEIPIENKTKSLKPEKVALRTMPHYAPTQEASLLPVRLANPATAVGAALSLAQQREAAKYSNLGFVLNPNFATEHNIAPEIIAYKQQKCLEYIARFATTAREEAEQFGIPVSIKLAQALLESNAGDSQLASKENNHFGIKCASKCESCRCANYADDSPRDMFRVFDSAWYSFREHSKLLSNKRYKHLLEIPRTDYKNWAYGLQAAGYATDKQYAKKLIAIIEAFQLYQFDH